MFSYSTGNKCTDSSLTVVFCSVNWHFAERTLMWMETIFGQSFLPVQSSSIARFWTYSYNSICSLYAMRRVDECLIGVLQLVGSVVSRKLSLRNFSQSCLILSTDSRLSLLTFMSFCFVSFWHTLQKSTSRIEDGSFACTSLALCHITYRSVCESNKSEMIKSLSAQTLHNLSMFELGTVASHARRCYRSDK